MWMTAPHSHRTHQLPGEGMGGGSQSNSSHEQEQMIALATLALKSPTSQLTSQSKLQ